VDLYFSPLSCSMASRIALYDAGATAAFIQVDAATKRTSAGDDFRAINPLGLVPTLRTDAGELLTENAADLAPVDGFALAQLQQWLCFIGTELHKVVFAPLLSKVAPAEVKAYALASSRARLEVVERHLTDREFLLDRFSVADAYLVTVLTWAAATPIDLGDWPALRAYVTRLRARPSVARALAEEVPLYRREQAGARP